VQNTVCIRSFVSVAKLVWPEDFMEGHIR